MLARLPVPNDEVCLSAENGLDQVRDVGASVLAIAIGVDNNIRAQLHNGHYSKDTGHTQLIITKRV